MIGTVLNERYRLDAEIGRGGMGMVFQAHDTALERDVAVKVLSEASGLGTEGTARLLQEARAAAQVNHPNIVSVHDVGEADGLPFIVMELVEGESLHERRPGTLADVVAVAGQVCSALEHAHAHSVVHRDLKPENVLLARDGTAKLSDFGLARSVASRVTSEGTIVGSVFYLAPEVALGREFDGRADLYALGVMLYELTTGRLPFTADDPVAVISQHLHAPVFPPRGRNPKIPAALDALIVRLLSKDPGDRPFSASEVLQILEEPGILDKDAFPAEELSVLERIERGRMVGRERELQEARALWHKALAGQGQTLLISGEPGIGKTRLVRELITQAEISGGQAVVGVSYAEGGMPYAPFRQIIRELLRGGVVDRLDLPQFVLADLLTLTPELRSHYPHVPENAPLGPHAEQQRLFENLAIFQTALSDQAPLLLVVEDIHWADSGTLSLLRHLARHTRRQATMIVATYFAVQLEEARPLHQVLLDLERERLAARFKLARLGREETRELLSVLFAEEITDQFLDGIYRETEGNPFFIEEVCKALVESGKVYYGDGRWHRPESTAELGIPQSVRVAIQSRVGELPVDSQETLHLAAILGREFDFDTLTPASELDEDTLVDALERAERAQLIQEVSEEGRGTFTFEHRLIPTTLVEGLRTLERRRLHRRAASAVEVLHPDNFEALAYHYDEAGNSEKAADYLLKAGDRARGLLAHDEAIDHYERALQLLKERGDDERAARTLMKLGLTYHNAFDFKAARQAFEEGSILWQRVGDAKPAAMPPPAPHALRIAALEPWTLDPGLSVDFASVTAIDQLFSGLLEIRPDRGVVPNVARSWEVREGGREYVFHLRDDVRWSDGAPVTAADFEYAWKRVLDPTTGSPLPHLLYDVQGAKAYHQGEEVDPDSVGVHALHDLKLEVQLEGPTSYFPYLLTYVPTFAVPRHVVEAHGPGWTDFGKIVSNGPFKLAAYERGEALILERNPDYHGRVAGNVERVECSLLSGESARALQLYEQDHLEAIFFEHVPQAEWDRIRQRYVEEYVPGPELGTYYVGFDVSRPPFDDRRVRQAFTLATDTEALAHVTLRGYVFPASGGLVPPGMPGHSPEIGVRYDPEMARQLLAEAGYPGGRGFPTIESLAPDWYLARPALGHLAGQWHENLGVRIAWKTMEWEKFGDRVLRRTPHLWLLRWLADYPDPDSFLRASIWRVLSTWENEVYDQLVEGARRLEDQKERMKMYQRADRILTEEAPLLLLCYGRFHLLVKPWVSRYPSSSAKQWFWKDVVIEPH
jgi:ABC-type oligopeptide transport system substrate-binding subunit/tetratricopeptide (TPR) repeat protein